MEEHVSNLMSSNIVQTLAAAVMSNLQLNQPTNRSPAAWWWLQRDGLRRRSDVGRVEFRVSSEKTWRWWERKRSLGIAIGAFVLGLAILTLAGWLCLIRRRRKTQEPQIYSVVQL